jgi:hypothetical protein
MLFGNFQIQPGTTISIPSPNPISALDTPIRAYMGAFDEIHLFGPSAVMSFVLATRDCGKHCNNSGARMTSSNFKIRQ